MSIALNLFYPPSFIQSMDNVREHYLKPSIEKVKAAVSSSTGKFMIGALISYPTVLLCTPICDAIFSYFGGVDPASRDFIINDIKKMSKSEVAYFSCESVLFAPFLEEFLFRELLQDKLKEKFCEFYTAFGLSKERAIMASRISTVFATAIIFGLSHFSNALVNNCNYQMVLPQIVWATMIGILLSASKELTDSIIMPIGIHFGNNLLALIEILRSAEKIAF